MTWMPNQFTGSWNKIAIIISGESGRIYPGFIPGSGHGGCHFFRTRSYGKEWISKQYLDFASQDKEGNGIEYLHFRKNLFGKLIRLSHASHLVLSSPHKPSHQSALPNILWVTFSSAQLAIIWNLPGATFVRCGSGCWVPPSSPH